ncbi:MAG: type II secretion system protein [Limisphaerales bacterium]
MKTNPPIADGRRPMGKLRARGFYPIVNRQSPILNSFTLIELLVVIAVIGILAAFILPVASAAKRHSIISHAQAEMNQIETALDSYKAAYGFYPSWNTNSVVTDASINDLYFELVGTTNDGGYYYTLDRSAQPIPDAGVQTAFGIVGFVNCDSTNKSSENSQQARNFLPDLKPNQYTTKYTNNNTAVALLISSVGGPDANYQPLGAPDLNPWRYRSPGINDPNGYDLWIDLSINGKTNRISNWDTRVETVSAPLP